MVPMFITCNPCGMSIRGVLIYAHWILGEEPHCHWCKFVFRSKKEITIDHVIARAEGGVNHPKNCVLSCLKCNQKRGKETCIKLHRLGVGIKYQAGGMWLRRYGQKYCAI